LEFKIPIVISAETGYWPPANGLKEKYPISKSIFKYVNSITHI